MPDRIARGAWPHSPLIFEPLRGGPALRPRHAFGADHAVGQLGLRLLKQDCGGPREWPEVPVRAAHAGQVLGDQKALPGFDSGAAGAEAQDQVGAGRSAGCAVGCGAGCVAAPRLAAAGPARANRTRVSDRAGPRRTRVRGRRAESVWCCDPSGSPSTVTVCRSASC
jgi:hypothetical protein